MSVDSQLVVQLARAPFYWNMLSTHLTDNVVGKTNMEDSTSVPSHLEISSKSTRPSSKSLRPGPRTSPVLDFPAILSPPPRRAIDTHPERLIRLTP